MTKAHTDHPQKVKVWAGIVEDRILDPFFLVGLRNFFVSVLQDLLILHHLIFSKGLLKIDRPQRFTYNT